MIFVMRSSKITLVADVASVFSKAFLTISFVMQQLHVSLIKNSSSEFHVANVTDMRLFHVRFNMTCSG